MSKHQAGLTVARQLQRSEHAIDAAIASTMKLGAEMLEGRKTAKFAANVGQKALVEVISGLSAMATAREAIITAHADLLNVADDHAVIWRLDGASESKPPLPLTVAPPAVANAA